jgi:drug/metabolite transporter (DMT)-like permease
MSAAIFLGLLSALLYGSTDFVARIAGRAVGPLRTIFLGHGLAASVVAAFFVFGRQSVPSLPGMTWAFMLASNALTLAATGCLYRALTNGRLTVVAPVAASYGGVAALLAAASGERFSAVAWVGMAALFLGCVLSARPRATGPTAALHSGAGMAAAAALLYGLGFWLQGAKVIPAAGFVLPTLTYYLLGTCTTGLIGWSTARDMRIAQRNLPLVFGTTVLACGGTLALAAGQTTGQVGLVTLLSSLASAVTVFLARVFLKEQMAWTAYLGLALIVAGLALVHWRGI